MMNSIAAEPITAADLMIALNEFFPNATFGAIPVIDQQDALEIYRAFDDGTLAEAPQALAAYVRHQQYSAG